ncbi:hypothetical protein J6590_036559 [Homalodisca vitripennis]|nr:hypothetical protein J6590_036559 [Homalodisca vitripennis]
MSARVSLQYALVPRLLLVYYYPPSVSVHLICLLVCHNDKSCMQISSHLPYGLQCTSARVSLQYVTRTSSASRILLPAQYLACKSPHISRMDYSARQLG